MFKRLTRLGIILLVLAALVLPYGGGVTAQSSRWHVESLARLSEVLDGFGTVPHRVTIAPDGRQVAYESERSADGESRLCVLDLPQQQERCILLPREYHFSSGSLLPSLRWSPDSAHIATIGAPYITFRDTDLGIVDLATLELTYTNLADDGYTGNFALAPDPLPSNVTVPSYPAFSPDSAQIAIEQAFVAPDGSVGPATISIVDVATGEVRDLSRLPGHEIYERDMGSVVGMDWSPDGATLVFSLRHPRLEPAYDGIWRLEVETGSLTHLLTVEDAQSLADEIYGDIDVFLAATPVLWSPDGSRLLFWVGAPGAVPLREWVFWIEVASGEITPMPLPATLSDSANFGGLWPLQAVWSPDGSLLLVSARLDTPPDDALPLVDTDNELATALVLIDVESGELTLLGHLPLEPAGLFTAAWGPDNDVIAGGYYFKLVQE